MMSEPGYKPLLSVLMPTLVRREELFLALAGKIAAQAEAVDQPVEVVGLQNTGERPLAEYRELLLRDARGTYLCYVDDDDDVPDIYVHQITQALTTPLPHDCKPGAGGCLPDDHFTYPDVITWIQDSVNLQARITLFGLQFLGAPWPPVTVNGELTYLRVYSHMQPILTEIARQGSFIVPGGLGFTQEDQHFANSVVPILLARGSRQAHIPQVMYTYRFMAAGHSTQEGMQPDADDSAHERPVIKSPCFRWYGS